ncbi:uncharacterized protein LOC127283134 [Leptopilina boulardi]|uniref:uncharacterized protein LOC127283134 n=1 Tax=Leptopilina boulardi TaxID=63433 RepID=UPI0021F6962C|nr:uncharacterized protein LOC127283134 [Leptopilina boulardi]
MNFVQFFLFICFAFNVAYCFVGWPTKDEAASHCIQPPLDENSINSYQYYCSTVPIHTAHTVYPWHIALDKCLKPSSSRIGYWKCRKNSHNNRYYYYSNAF